MISHSVPITSGSDAHEFLFQISRGATTLGTVAVDIFFVTSGFLITGSLLRSTNLVDFAWRRVVRILPALLVVVLAAIFAIGPWFTTEPVVRYFEHRSTYAYLLNSIFVFCPSLPGVFLTVPYAGAVNGSLWTLFYEVACYATVAAARVFRRATGVAIVGLFVLTAACDVYQSWPGRFQHFVDLGSFFFAGAALYVLRGRVPYNSLLCMVAGLISFLLPALGVVPGVSQFATAYACIWLGFQKSFEPPGDYSYGIYLWAFPVQQIWMAAVGRMPWWENVALSLPVTVILGYLSWTFVESKAMKSKSMLARFRLGSPAERV